MISIKLRKKGKNRRNIPPLPVTLKCQLCRKTFKTARLYANHHPIVMSSGFTNHLNARPNCKEFYDQNFKKDGGSTYIPRLREMVVLYRTSFLYTNAFHLIFHLPILVWHELVMAPSTLSIRREVALGLISEHGQIPMHQLIWTIKRYTMQINPP